MVLVRAELLWEAVLVDPMGKQPSLLEGNFPLTSRVLSKKFSFP